MRPLSRVVYYYSRRTAFLAESADMARAQAIARGRRSTWDYGQSFSSCRVLAGPTRYSTPRDFQALFDMMLEYTPSSSNTRRKRTPNRTRTLAAAVISDDLEFCINVKESLLKHGNTVLVYEDVEPLLQQIQLFGLIIIDDAVVNEDAIEV